MQSFIFKREQQTEAVWREQEECRMSGEVPMPVSPDEEIDCRECNGTAMAVCR